MTQGETLLELCRSMRKLNEEIAALMKTADNILSRREFHPEGSNAVIGDSSKSLDLPEKWTPMKMYRRYQNKRNRDEVIVLNIGLDSRSKPDVFDEPLVLCGRFLYEKGQAVEGCAEWDSWDMWKYRAIEGMKVGEVYTKKDLQQSADNFKRFIDESEWGKEVVATMKEIKFIAVSLADIADSKALDRQVFQQIL